MDSVRKFVGAMVVMAGLWGWWGAGLVLGAGPAISNVSLVVAPQRPYEKYEVKFGVSTVSVYPFFQYDDNPPPGIAPRIGINVEGRITNTTTGKTSVQPAFYMTDVSRTGTGSGMRFTETASKHWTVRFSPQEKGAYQVSLYVKDAGEETTVSAPGFTVSEDPVKKGFVKVAPNDKRYFEFSNGELYWPIGPANGSLSQYNGTGINFVRPWMGGSGAYSTNWARWKSSAEQHGNEGIKTRLTFFNDPSQKAPGSDGLAYELFYPEGHHTWLTSWLDEQFYTSIKSNTTYQIKLVVKTTNITGPRVSGYPYGFVVKFGPSIFNNPTNDQIETQLRTAPNPFGRITTTSGTNGWQTFQTSFTTPSSTGPDIWIYLDNVTGGQAYVYELSIKDASGAELVRNPTADNHLYVEQRPAAFFDWQVEQAELNGVFLDYVVHDKNDWIPNHLNDLGQWTTQGNGYNPPANTKARWLLRQWYRYLAARWGYSTAIHTWEMVNEEDPNNTVHWGAAQSFAKFMHDTDAQPHLVKTSFWCCWRPNFWLGSSYPDVDYADIHMYSNNPDGVPNRTYDMALWNYELSMQTYQDRVSRSVFKPVMRGETGIMTSGIAPELQQPNPGVWYHNLLWAGLNPGAMTDPNYWFSEHLSKINTKVHSLPFFQFVSSLDLNKGGYVDAQAVPVNAKIRAWGQKNLAKNKAHLWVQNSDHTWKKVMDAFGQNDGNVSLVTSDIIFKMNPTTSYIIEWWDTYTGVKTQQTGLSNSTGDLKLTVTNLGKDTAVKVIANALVDTPTVAPTPVIPTAVLTATPTPAGGASGDVNGDGEVNSTDVKLVLQNWLGTATAGLDQYPDGKINSWDFAVVAGKIAAPTPTAASASPTPTIVVTTGGDWTQEAHDAQRTSYTAVEPLEPWTLIWTWNGPDATGGTGSHFYHAPKEARTITGGNFVYVPAGTNGLYALNKSNGQQAWRVTASAFNHTPAFADGYVYAGGSDGILYKLNALTGGVAATYTAGNPVARSVLLVGTHAYVVTNDGRLHKVNTGTMSQVWVYTAGSTNYPDGMGLSYSASRQIVIFGTGDLYVHAVNDADGTRKWRVKPSPNTAGFPNQYLWYHPVVAEQHGIVFVRMRLSHNPGLWGGPGPDGRYPNTNAETRTFLQSNPELQNLFALNLDNGTPKFVPAVGYGGAEDLYQSKPYLTTGPLPVVKTLPGNIEVAYNHFRNGSSGTDGRWDSHMGEMVLDNATVPGLVAGDMRFVKMSRYNGYGGNSYVYITDEYGPLTMAGDTLFHAHQAASESIKITDRSSAKGLTYSNPIAAVNHPTLIRRQSANNCSNKNTTTHWTTCGLELYEGSGISGRFWNGPGWWTYWNVTDPPNDPNAGAYSLGILPRYTYVAGNLVVVEGNGGELMVFRHAGL